MKVVCFRIVVCEKGLSAYILRTKYTSGHISVASNLSQPNTLCQSKNTFLKSLLTTTHLPGILIGQIQNHILFQPLFWLADTFCWFSKTGEYQGPVLQLVVWKRELMSQSEVCCHWVFADLRIQQLLYYINEIWK